MRKGLVLVMVSLVGCKDKAAPTVAVESPKTTPSTIQYIVAKPVITRAPVPSRFKAPIPYSRDVIENKQDTFPSYHYMREGIALNTAGMRERLMTSIRIATGKGPAPEEMALWYAGLIGYAPSEELCDWIVGVAAGSEPVHLRTVFWWMSEHCRGAKYATRMTGDEVPHDIVVEAYAALDGPVAFNPRVARAAAVFAKDPENAEMLDLVGNAFANMTGPESLAAFAAIQKGLSGTAAARAAAGLMRSPDPAVRAHAEKACTNPEVAKEPMCTDREAAAARSLAKGDTGQTTDELAACAKTESYEAAECLQKLAGKDRAAAIAIAKAANTAGKEDFFSKTARDLVKYPEADAIEKYFASLGITPVSPAGKTADIGIESTLRAYGRLDQFDTETGQFPNEHDELLARLAKLASPALDGVVFEEVAPPDDEGPYTLYAYSDRQRFEVSAQNNGDWYDMTAVIGLLNAVLENRSSPYRYVVLPTGDQTAIVLAAPQRALEQLVADSAIQVEDANAAMRDGKAFEERAIDELKKRGEILIE